MDVLREYVSVWVGFERRGVQRRGGKEKRDKSQGKPVSRLGYLKGIGAIEGLEE